MITYKIVRQCVEGSFKSFDWRELGKFILLKIILLFKNNVTFYALKKVTRYRDHSYIFWKMLVTVNVIVLHEPRYYLVTKRRERERDA